MNDELEFEYVTTDAAVDTFKSAAPIFEGLLKEVRELSKKKPEATMSEGKVRIVNRVLEDLLSILKDEPPGKYLDLLDDKSLPQLSDAVLTMVQFETALRAFRARYYQRVHDEQYWITSELLEDWKNSDAEDGEDADEDDESDDGIEDDDDDPK